MNFHNVFSISFCLFVFTAFSQNLFENFLGSQKQFWNNEYLVNTSFTGLNKEKNIILSNQSYNAKGRSVFTDKSEYSQSLFVNYCIKDNNHKPSLGFVVENHFPDNLSSSKSAFGIISTTSFFINKIQIRPSINVGTRYDFQNLNNIFEKHPLFFDSIKPTSNINSLTLFINSSLLVEYRDFYIGFSIFNINSPNILIINESYKAPMKTSFYFSKKIFYCSVNQSFSLTPYFLFINNSKRMNPKYMSDLNIIFYNQYQLTSGINFENNKNIIGIQLGYYPAAYNYFKGNNPNRKISLKEAGFIYGRKISNNFKIHYSLNISCHSSISALSFFDSRLNSIYLHNICLNYRI